MAAYTVKITVHKGGELLESGARAEAGQVEAKVEGLMGASCDGLLDALADELDSVTRRHTQARKQTVRTATRVKVGGR